MTDDEFSLGELMTIAVVFVSAVVAMCCCGCSSPAVSESSYPEYDKWWTWSVNTNSLEGLGQGGVYVHEYVTTNIVIGAAGLRQKIVTNRMEAVLL